MDYFAQPRLRRDQLVLISTTLDDAVPQEHEVRLLDEILCGQDWSTWESHYGQRRGRGQPPIPPRVLASVILYGLIRRIRSSRVLEYMVGNNLDFMWLAEGRNIDHTTLCKFRTRFKQPLKELFRGLARLAMTMGLIRLGEITFDGTRAKANNGRSQIWTAAAVEKRLAELEAQFGQALDEAERTDAAEDEQFGLVSKPALPPELADAKARQQLLKEALKELKAADAARHRKGTDPTENPAQLPSTDLDSTVLPNKEGGYAPNYTPTAAVDTHRDFIVDPEVLADANENTQVVPMVDRVEEAFGQRPSAVLSDGLNATGPNIAELEQRGVEFLTPAGPSESTEGNPAVRDDPRQPVPEAAWPKLPINPHTKKLDKSCFLYVSEEDRYYCPRATALDFEKTKPEIRQGQKITLRVYRADCAGCPLAGKCVSEKSKGGRTITRDCYTPDRERHAAKMRTDDARTRYARRFHAGETPFGWLKHVLGLRQFLLRGLEKVRVEWLWACTGYNLNKLILAVRRLRAEFAAFADGEIN
jgi:transposase